MSFRSTDCGQHVDSGCSCGSKDFDDFAFGIDVARFPRFQTNNDFVVTRRCFRQLCVRRNLNVDIVHQSRIVRHDVIKIPRLLQCSDNRVARALEDADDAAFAPMLRWLARPDLGAARRDVATDPCHHPVAVHCGAGILSGDENVRVCRLFRDKETVTDLMDRQFPSDKIGFGWKDVPILANANNFAGMLQLVQSFANFNAIATLQSERSRDLISIAWPIIRSPQQGEELFSNCATVFGHVDENILEIVRHGESVRWRIDLTTEFKR